MARHRQPQRGERGRARAGAVGGPARPVVPPRRPDAGRGVRALGRRRPRRLVRRARTVALASVPTRTSRRAHGGVGHRRSEGLDKIVAHGVKDLLRPPIPTRTVRLDRVRAVVGEAGLDRSADRDVGGGASPAGQGHRAPGVRLGRHLVDGVRDRRDRPRAVGAGRGWGRGVGVSGPVGDRRGDLARDRRGVVPPDDLRLSVGRRVVRRVPGEPRRDTVVGGWRLLADGLHPDGCGVRGRWRLGHPVGVRLRQPLPGTAVSGPDRR